MTASENEHKATRQAGPSVEAEAGEGAAESAAVESEGAQAAGEPQAAEAVDIEHLLADARAKADEHWNQLLRTQAELQNMRRRSERDIQNAHKFALEKFALELLPVKDSLELGLLAATGEAADVAKLREGVELTLKMLTTAMEKFEIREVNPLGDSFNPEFHQAMSMQESTENAPNTVLAVMQKGYLLNDRLIRPAMVVVSKGAGDAEDASPRVDEKA